METNPLSFLEFNGKTIIYLNAAGQYWVAVKPICEALGIHYKHQHEMILKDNILGQLSCEYRIVAADGKLRNMVCLPEKFIYGWLFGIRSESEALRQYKLQCYEALFNHFHGIMTKRKQILHDKLADLSRQKELEEKLKVHEDFVEYERLRGNVLRSGKLLKEMDQELLTGQMSLLKDLEAEQ